MIADELEQPIGLAAFAAEVHVGDEQRAKPAFRRHGAAIPPVAIVFVVAIPLAMIRSAASKLRIITLQRLAKLCCGAVT
jgi:hypothetical protein